MEAEPFFVRLGFQDVSAGYPAWMDREDDCVPVVPGVCALKPDETAGFPPEGQLAPELEREFFILPGYPGLGPFVLDFSESPVGELRPLGPVHPVPEPPGELDVPVSAVEDTRSRVGGEAPELSLPVRGIDLSRAVEAGRLAVYLLVEFQGYVQAGLGPGDDRVPADLRLLASVLFLEFQVGFEVGELDPVVSSGGSREFPGLVCVGFHWGVSL
jgi:hypothetical protein